MRAIFACTLAELAARRPEILLMTADLGFMALEPFSDAAPKQFFNVGVSEQNMVGLATGMAEAGFVPYVYSIATFATLRPYEFIRNGPVAHRLPVRIVGVGAGFEYGTAGNTHHCLEDLAVLRALDGLTIVSPADVPQARAAILATVDHPGPIYLRLSKDDKAELPALAGRFALGRAELIRSGRDVVFVTMGRITAEAWKAAEMLAARGIDAAILVVSSINPTPSDDIAAALSDKRLAVTVEEHAIDGGLGSLVSEIVAERGIATRVLRCGVRGRPRLSGEQAFCLEAVGLTAPRLTETVESALPKEAV